jgi:hypothetical protein
VDMKKQCIGIGYSACMPHVVCDILCTETRS